MNKIYFIGGGKGGVGKSAVSIGLIDTLLASKKPVSLVESDTSNPDVYKMYKDEVESVLINLDEADGWIDLVNFCDNHPDTTIVVNTAARNNRGITTYSATLNTTLSDLKRQLVTLWVINRQRDSIELLKEYIESFPIGELHVLHVLRNSYFGDSNKFELYNGSKTCKLIESKNGKTLTFPELADRVSDDLYSKRLSITKALNELPIGNRAELKRWQHLIHKMMAEVIDD